MGKRIFKTSRNKVSSKLQIDRNSEANRDQHFLKKFLIKKEEFKFQKLKPKTCSIKKEKKSETSFILTARIYPRQRLQLSPFLQRKLNFKIRSSHQAGALEKKIHTWGKFGSKNLIYG